VLDRARKVVEQAEYLLPRYAVVVANPPYMGSGNFVPGLRQLLEGRYKVTRSDLYAIFMERCLALSEERGSVALITMQAWMFTASYETLRCHILGVTTIQTVAQFGARAFESISGEIVATAAFVLLNSPPRSESRGIYARLLEGGAAEKAEALRESQTAVEVRQSLMTDLPSQPLVYWEAALLDRLYRSHPPIGEIAPIREGIHTGDNASFLRFWWEVSKSRLKLDARHRDDIDAAGARWVPYNKGGTATRWYGNNLFVVAFDRSSRRKMRELSGFVEPSKDLYFREGGTWSDVGTTGLKVKYFPCGYLFDAKGPVVVGGDQTRFLIGAMNSSPFGYVGELLMPTISYKAGTVKKIPLPSAVDRSRVNDLVADAIAIAKEQWDASEMSWEFAGSVSAESRDGLSRLADFYRYSELESLDRSSRLREIELENNRHFEDCYDLSGDGNVRELSFELSTAAPLTLRQFLEQLVSYAVGCMFGRYSLDVPGLVLADQGASLEDFLAKVPSPSFVPDGDNVIPFVDGDWFDDDVVGRFREFLRVAFGEEHFEENLQFVTESLGVRTLRDYFVKSFYKDHVQRYKKRPIYWMFSSPKGSFNALVYLHRYTPSTVSTVLNEYLREFQGKLRAALENAEKSNDSKEADRLRKVLVELDEYERDTLFPLAAQQIELDLDAGVRANYSRMGTALAKIPGFDRDD
jgi:hypothetical protein